MGQYRLGVYHPSRHGAGAEELQPQLRPLHYQGTGARITVHGTRKTCGSLLAALDVHPRVAMQILRHSKIAVTMEIYTEVPSAATREALRKLGQWLDS
jgi:integrase